MRSGPFTLRTALVLAILPATLSAQVPAIRTVLDATGEPGLGRYNSVAFGPDGRGLIAYHAGQTLKVAHCQDAACTSATFSTIDSGGVGRFTSIAFAPDGRAHIAYRDEVNRTLKVARCADAACTTATLQTIASDTGQTAIAVPPDGRPVVLHQLPFAMPPVCRVTRCADASCSASANAVDIPALVGVSPTIAVGADGLPLFSCGGQGDLQVHHCTASDCAATTSVTVPAVPGPVTQFFTATRLAVGPDGRGVVAYQFRLNNAVRRVEIRRCLDAACATLSPATILAEITTADASPPLALAVSSAGRVAVVNAALRVVDCALPACAGAANGLLDTAGEDRSVAIGPQGVPLVAYYFGPHLKVASLVGAEAPPDLSVTLTSVHGATAVFGSAVGVNATVRNLGGQPAGHATLTSPLPTGWLFDPVSSAPPACTAAGGTFICPLGDLAPGTERLVELRGWLDENVSSSFANAVMVASAPPDNDPTNNAASLTTTVNPRYFVEPAFVQEGDTGTREAVFTVRKAPPLDGITGVGYRSLEGSASFADFQATLGTLTFPAGTSVRTATVNVFGDDAPEADETFELRLEFGGLPVQATIGVIVDDDAPSLSRVELTHGSVVQGDLAPGPLGNVDVYRVAQQPYASYEAVVDGTAGEATAPVVERLDGLGTFLAGAISALRWANTSSTLPGGALGAAPVPILSHSVRVRSSSCGSGCGALDQYRLRFYETTLSSPRFNNRNGQVAFLILQNPTSTPVTATVVYWSEAGARLLVRQETLGARTSQVFATQTQFPLLAQAGSVTVAHTGPYGGLAGKVVMLDPAAGFSFDSPLLSRPR